MIISAPKIQGDDAPATQTPATEAAPTPAVSEAPPAIIPSGAETANEKAVGHKRDQIPAKQVVTTASCRLEALPAAVNPPSALAAVRTKVDFAYLRQQVTMEQLLQHLGILGLFRGKAQQRRGPCPIHVDAPATMPIKKHTCSVQLGKNIFHCFQAECAAHGNVLDLWAAVHRLPLYEAALHLAATFHLPTNREEAPVMAAQHPAAQTGAKGTVITANGC
jgi:hypothetical protein